MAETPPDAKAKPNAPLLRRFKPLDALADAAIAWLRRYAPKNFGVDLEPPAARPSLRRSPTKAKLMAFARELLSTRLDRSGARIRTLALGMFVAYAGDRREASRPRPLARSAADAQTRG